MSNKKIIHRPEKKYSISNSQFTQKNNHHESNRSDESSVDAIDQTDDYNVDYTSSQSDDFDIESSELSITDSEDSVSLDKLPSKSNSMKNKSTIFKELVSRQLDNVPDKWKLNVGDMKRICKYIDTSIFDESECCEWLGYITNINNSNKGTYVNFYFRNKKVALHRLLYSNFVAPLDSSEYLKFNCENRGTCCNVNHYEKYRYSKKKNDYPNKSKPIIENKSVKKKSIQPKQKMTKITKKDLVVKFD